MKYRAYPFRITLEATGKTAIYSAKVGMLLVGIIIFALWLFDGSAKLAGFSALSVAILFLILSAPEILTKTTNIFIKSIASIVSVTVSIMSLLAGIAMVYVLFFIPVAEGNTGWIIKAFIIPLIYVLFSFSYAQAYHVVYYWIHPPDEAQQPTVDPPTPIAGAKDATASRSAEHKR